MTLLPGCQRNISGSYLASDNGTVAWLQVVRTPDNHLTGQLAETTLKSDGSIERNSVPVSGAVDGENVTIQGNGFLGLNAFVLSGTIKGDLLTLTGVQSIPFEFRRSTSSEFEAKAAALNTRSQAIIQARAAAQSQQRTLEAQRKFVAEIDQVIGLMQQFDTQADIHLGRFPGAEKAYEEVTARVSRDVERERQLAGNPNAAVARSQLSVAANQASFRTEELHNQGKELETVLETNLKPMGDRAKALQEQCRTLSLNPGSPAQQDINSACERLGGTWPTFKEKFNAMVSGLSHLEQVYTREQDKQQHLVQESERLE